MRFFRLLSLCCLALFVLASHALAQGVFPQRPIKLIVPFAPGGSTDLVARLVAEKMQAALGQPVVVDNRAGSGGAIGSEALARAQPDGYTIGIGTVSTLAVNPILLKANRVDPLNDFAPLIALAEVPSVFMVHPSFPGGHGFGDVVARLRANPGRYDMGSSGPGSVSHLIIEAMNADLKVHVVHVPYRGMGPAVSAALAGQTQLASDQYPSSAGYIQAGKLVAFAVAAHGRLQALPEVPTLAELGHPQLNALAITWFGIVAPARTPAAVQKTLHDAAADALRDPALAARMKELGMEPAGGTPEDFRRLIASSLERNRRIVQAARISAQ